ncbi:tetratricopeptide repeat protein [Marinibactrum halimedae]|uniref:Tol-pal system protein YbgF n=1 Tax=Marinibactrum halimedae TaxID=1444977 RepID=A0AA37T2S2_9GAMM|nr:tetratricopeptide repeat protein [Marinibactrum halimedae]MCD9457513.1 tetratricopeptide repeat protein [Marinibactrum halimedae]GLS25433.1 tol-pal system protein YbgF [Marinibactrum halimedae]
MTLKMITVAIVATVFSVNVFSQARVFDSQPDSSSQERNPASATSYPTNQPPPPKPVNASTDLFYNFQLLQQEVLELRGLVEQQAFEIKRLKQQRLDDYMDLDRRVSDLSKSGMSPATRQSDRLNQATNLSSGAADLGTPSSLPSSMNNTAQPVIKEVSERYLYRQAIDLLLKKKDFDGASSLLSQYLNDFPDGLYAPNALYWLGEISLSKGQLAESQQWFSRLLSAHPDHSKVSDAKFKLAKVYHQSGDSSAAKSLLVELAEGNSNASSLAKEYLQVNFP